MIALVAALGLVMPAAIPVQVQGIAKGPDVTDTLAPLVLIRVTGDAKAVPVSLTRMVLPALDKAGDPAELVLVTDDRHRKQVVRLRLVAADTKGKARYAYDGPPVPLPAGRLLLCAPVDSTWMRLVVRRKLARKLRLSLVRTESGEPVKVTLKALKRPRGFEPERWADRSAAEWAKELPALTETKEAGHYQVPAGVWRLDSDLVVPRGVTLHIGEGTTLLLAPSRSLFSYGRLDIRGTVEAPVVIRPSGAGPWGTVSLIGPGSAGSVIQGVRFIRGSMWFAGARDLNGTISVIDSDVTIERSRFEECRGEDVLHIERSSLTLRESGFYQCSSDGVDLEASKGRIEDCTFVDVGDDAIDAGESSKIEIDAVLVQNARGKAISVGQDTRVSVTDSFLLESGRGISAFEGGSVMASTCVVAFARRAGVQATARRGTESGRVKLTRSLFWQNGGPAPEKNKQITLELVRSDVPVDLAKYAPVDGPAGQKIGPDRLPVKPPKLLNMATGTEQVLVGTEGAQGGVPGESPGPWLLMLAAAVVALGGLLLLERKLRI